MSIACRQSRSKLVALITPCLLRYGHVRCVPHQALCTAEASEMLLYSCAMNAMLQRKGQSYCQACKSDFSCMGRLLASPAPI